MISYIFPKRIKLNKKNLKMFKKIAGFLKIAGLDWLLEKMRILMINENDNQKIFYR